MSIGIRMLSLIQAKYLWRRSSLFAFFVSLSATLLAEDAKQNVDWAHWRGPTQDGQSYETNLPESWSVDGENLLWRKEEYATRSTPVVMNGRVYVVCRAFPESNKEGEKTVCLNAETGDLIWESIHNIYLSDAPAERVGWSSVVCDPETDRVYVLGLGCVFECLDGKTGKIVWSHSMGEEYGMLSTYGGRTNFPTIFEDLIIVSGVMTGWGDTAVPAHRFVAFDKSTGVAAWLMSTKVRPEDTTYSTPVFTSFNGQAAMVVGAADGAVYAFQPRTGKEIWKYQASPRGINVTPLIDEDGIVYCAHGEKNMSDLNVLGALFAIDGKMTGEIPEDKLVWKIPAKAVGRSSPVKIKDRIYYLEDGAALHIVDAKTGKIVGDKKLGRVMFGSPVVGDGKIYIAENTGKIWILKPSEKGVDVVSSVRMTDGGEVFGAPVISNGRIYIPTNSALYCIGSKDRKPSPVTKKYEAPKETPVADDLEVAHIQLSPVELLLAPGRQARYQVRAYNKKGQFLKLVPAEFSVEGTDDANQMKRFTAPSESKSAAITITAKHGELKSTARVRVVPELPWKMDFNDKAVPPTWIGASYRHQPKEVDGESVLVKISSIPKGTRSQSWMGWTNLENYTVQGDFYATDAKTEVKGVKDQSDRLPDFGLIAQRYTLDLQGAQKLEIRSWTARRENRFAKTIDFKWDVKTWYTMKFQSENTEKGATLRGKVWKRGEPEPEAWQIEATDETPNKTGSPGLFGNSTDAEFYIDNVSVTPNK